MVGLRSFLGWILVSAEVGRQWQVRQALGPPFGDESARGFGLCHDPFQRCGREGGEGLPNLDVVSIGVVLFHFRKMADLFDDPRTNREASKLDLSRVVTKWIVGKGEGEAPLIFCLKDRVAISNGSACTSSSYKPSHVIKAMGYSDDEANEAVRLSWCHLTPAVDWSGVAERIKTLR